MQERVLGLDAVIPVTLWLITTSAAVPCSKKGEVPSEVLVNPDRLGIDR